MTTDMKKMTAAAKVFELLKGCSLGAVSICSDEGTVRLIVEDRNRFSAIPGSWGRVMIVLKGCTRFALVAPEKGVDLLMRVERLRPRLGAVNVRDGSCEVACDTGSVRGKLVMDPAALTLVLGGGRTIGADELDRVLGEMRRESNQLSCVG